MGYYFIVDTYIGEERNQYDTYIAEVRPIVERYGGKYLVRTEKVQSLCENRTPQRSIVIRFPTKEALLHCFESEEYQAIAGKRIANVDARAIIVPGMEEEL